MSIYWSGMSHYITNYLLSTYRCIFIIIIIIIIIIITTILIIIFLHPLLYLPLDFCCICISM